MSRYQRDQRRCCGTQRGADLPHADGCSLGKLQAYRRGCCGTPVGRRRPHAPTCANEAQRLRVLAARAAYDKRVAAAACCDAPAKHGAAPCPMWEPDWTKGCGTCDAKPVLPHTGLCGPCTFGEAATAGGNW